LEGSAVSNHELKPRIRTLAQKRALKWLQNRNGDGYFDKNNVLVAGGDRAPIMRLTWNSLSACDLVEFYANKRRLKLTEAGRNFDISDVEESESHGDDE
jgi:hypothetical protein